jgi:hypothetical protein
MEIALGVDGGCIYCVSSAIAALVVTLPHHDWATSLTRAYARKELKPYYGVDEYLKELDAITAKELAKP